MKGKGIELDLVKMFLYILKRCWIVFLCAMIGFGFMYRRAANQSVTTYTASGTMYVYNANPNLVNYGYTSVNDISSAVMLMDTYLVVVKSNKVLDVVVERLIQNYPYMTPAYIASTLSMGSVGQTGVLRINCTTQNPQEAADICNAIMDVAPSEIIRVVSAGGIEIIDYASVPIYPNTVSVMKQGILGAVIGAVPPLGVLLVLFFLNQKIEDPKELSEINPAPLLASLKRYKEKRSDASQYLLKSDSEMELIESYAKLRMNLLYILAEKKKHSVLVASSVSGEGKSTIAANLAISVAMSDKKVLLVDADMRRACQHEIFSYGDNVPGLSDAITGITPWKNSLIKTHYENLDILPAGTNPTNSAELLESPAMHKLMKKLESAYDLVLLDAPPLNIVSDALALSDQVAGAIFMVRQKFTDRRELQKAIKQTDLTGMELLGFVFYGESLPRTDHYGRKNYYKSYQYGNRDSSGTSRGNDAPAKSAKKSKKRTHDDDAIQEDLLL